MLTWKDTVVCEQPSKVQALANYQIIRRNGAVVPFEPNKIAHAMMKAFMAVHGVLAFAHSLMNLIQFSLALFSRLYLVLWKIILLISFNF